MKGRSKGDRGKKSVTEELQLPFPNCLQGQNVRLLESQKLQASQKDQPLNYCPITGALILARQLQDKLQKSRELVPRDWAGRVLEAERPVWCPWQQCQAPQCRESLQPEAAKTHTWIQNGFLLQEIKVRTTPDCMCMTPRLLTVGNVMLESFSTSPRECSFWALQHP